MDSLACGAGLSIGFQVHPEPIKGLQICTSVALKLFLLESEASPLCATRRATFVLSELWHAHSPEEEEEEEEDEEEVEREGGEEEEEEEEEEDKLWRRRDNFRALETPPPLLPTHKSIRSR